MVHGARLKEVSQSHPWESGDFPGIFEVTRLTFSHPGSLNGKEGKVNHCLGAKGTMVVDHKH